LVDNESKKYIMSFLDNYTKNLRGLKMANKPKTVQGRINKKVTGDGRKKSKDSFANSMARAEVNFEMQDERITKNMKEMDDRAKKTMDNLNNSAKKTMKEMNKKIIKF